MLLRCLPGRFSKYSYNGFCFERLLHAIIEARFSCGADEEDSHLNSPGAHLLDPIIQAIISRSTRTICLLVYRFILQIFQEDLGIVLAAHLLLLLNFSLNAPGMIILDIYGGAVAADADNVDEEDGGYPAQDHEDVLAGVSGELVPRINVWLDVGLNPVVEGELGVLVLIWVRHNEDGLVDADLVDLIRLHLLIIFYEALLGIIPA